MKRFPASPMTVIKGQYERKEDKGPQAWNTSIDKKGQYQRKESAHRHFVAEGGEFPPEAGRYHLHVALACPWACGTLSMLFEKGLEGVISHSVVHPTWGKTSANPEDEHKGWLYRAPGDTPLPNPGGHGANECDEACIPDPVTNAKSIREVYELAGDPTGPFTTPILFDTKTNRIVNNESKEILRMFNTAFNGLAANPTLDLFPEQHEEALLKLNDEVIYPNINNGVYRSGFARSQEAYEAAVTQVFTALDQVELRLSTSRFLSGQVDFTWLDLRLFHTLVRFDPVYVVYFKTNEKRIADYPNLLGFMRDVYSRPAIQRTINMKHIKTHYFTSHPHLNTFGIVPIHNGPDLTLPHGRETIGSAKGTAL